MTDSYSPTRASLHLRAVDRRQPGPRPVRHRGAGAPSTRSTPSTASPTWAPTASASTTTISSPTAPSANERDDIVKRFRRALDATGMHVPMVTTNLFWRPVFKEGAFTANDPAVRRLAVKKACEATELGAELGADVFVLWGGREGMEAEAAKDVRLALDRYKEAIDLVCEHIAPGAWACASPSSPSRTSPGATSCSRPSATRWPSSASSNGPRWSGSTPSSPTRP